MSLWGISIGIAAYLFLPAGDKSDFFVYLKHGQTPLLNGRTWVEYFSSEPRRARQDDIPTSTNPGVPRRNENGGEDGVDGDVESMSGESIQLWRLICTPATQRAFWIWTMLLSAEWKSSSPCPK